MKKLSSPTTLQPSKTQPARKSKTSKSWSNNSTINCLKKTKESSNWRNFLGPSKPRNEKWTFNLKRGNWWMTWRRSTRDPARCKSDQRRPTKRLWQWSLKMVRLASITTDNLKPGRYTAASSLLRCGSSIRKLIRFVILMQMTNTIQS
jgi:hypothetical protein